MGSSPSIARPQAQVQVEPVKQAQIPIGCKCGNPKVKWKCELCVSMVCDRCKYKDHAAESHHIIHITTTPIKISDVQKYDARIEPNMFLAVFYNNSLWIGDGVKGSFASKTALQNVKLEGDKLKIISSYNLDVYGIAVTQTKDILLATGNSTRLKQIKAGTNIVTDSIYFVQSEDLYKLHVTKDGRVIVSGYSVVVVMDAAGNHITRYEKDKNNRQIFWSCISSLTSTTNGNILVACQHDEKVVVFKNTDIINIYRGHPTFKNWGRKFYPSSLVITPMDNVIVADFNTYLLHLLNNTGDLLTTFNTMSIGISYPEHLAIATEGSFTVLYMTSPKSTNLFKMRITEC